MIYSEIISGEKFQELCNAYCGDDFNLKRNPKFRDDCEKHLNLEKLSKEWDNPSLIFCYSSFIKTFIEKIEYLKNPFVLVSHNEDNNIDLDIIMPIVKSPLLIKWFSQNLIAAHPKIEFIPIGIANNMWPRGNANAILNIEQNKIKTNDFYFYFSLHTNYNERNHCKTVIESMGVRFGNNMEYSDYLNYLSSHKFAICPVGNGVDCHRTWECYYSGVIPILIENEFTKNLQNYLPCILLKKWEDFNADYCFANYDSLYKQLDTSKKYINFSFYKERILSSIYLKKINIFYAFIGKLPSYSVDTVYQMRLFYDGPIYFIISDYESEYVKILNNYNVTIIRYDAVISKEFLETSNNFISKFVIIPELNDRKNLFVCAFERFFVVYEAMKKFNIANVFFLELDNLVYDNPCEWLDNLSKKDMAFMFDNVDRFSAGVCYIKNFKALWEFCEFSLKFIENHTGFMDEMTCIYKYYGSNKDSVQLLPIHWEDSKYPELTYYKLNDYGSIFDSAAIGVYLGGVDPYHINVTRIYENPEKQKNKWSLIDYTMYEYKWELDSNGRNIPYIFSGTKWYRLNNLHIHSKNLVPLLSIPINS
jgi:hypothetical protein